MTKPKKKTTISIDADVLDSIRSAVAYGQAPSVSAYIEHAVLGQLASEADFDAVIEDMLTASGGPVTDEERRAAKALLSNSAP